MEAIAPTVKKLWGDCDVPKSPTQEFCYVIDVHSPDNDIQETKFGWNDYVTDLRHCTSQIQMDWTHPETWFTITWYNRRQDEGKSYTRKETATNAKWCNQQVLWRGWTLKPEVGGRKGRHKPAIQGRKPKRDYVFDPCKRVSFREDRSKNFKGVCSPNRWNITHLWLSVHFLPFFVVACSKNGWTDIHNLYIKRRRFTQGCLGQSLARVKIWIGSTP